LGEKVSFFSNNRTFLKLCPISPSHPDFTNNDEQQIRDSLRHPWLIRLCYGADVIKHTDHPPHFRIFDYSLLYYSKKFFCGGKNLAVLGFVTGDIHSRFILYGWRTSYFSQLMNIDILVKNTQVTRNSINLI